MDEGELPVERGLLMTDEEHLRREILGELMCHFRLDTAALSRRRRVDFASHFANELTRLESLERDGLIVIGPDSLEVTPRGRFLIRNVCMPFDAYLTAGTAGFSKAI